MRSLSIVEGLEEEEKDEDVEDPIPLVILSTPPEEHGSPLLSYPQQPNKETGYLSLGSGQDNDDSCIHDDEVNNENKEDDDYYFYTEHDDIDDNKAEDNAMLQLEDDPEMREVKERTRSFTMGAALIRNMSRDYCTRNY